MRTLCKKALALCLVAALALTCFVGTLSVSAAESNSYDATITVADVVISTPAETATAVLNISIPEGKAGINEAIFDISSTIGSATDVVLNDNYVVDAGTAEVVPTQVDNENNFNYNRFALSAYKADDATELNGITSATIEVTFAVAETAVAGKYPITIDVSGVRAADKDEVVINFVYEKEAKFIIKCDDGAHKYGDVTVVTAPTCGAAGAGTQECSVCGNVKEVVIDATGEHSYTYATAEAGKHSVDCPNCDTVFDPETCVDENQDKSCDKCNADLTEEEPECDHQNATANKVVKFEEGVINYYTECADCSELTLVSTDSSETAAAHAATVANFATYSAIELTTVGVATIKLADVEQAAIKLAYVSGDKIIANGAHAKTIEYNPISLTSYTDGVVTIDSTVTGIIIAFTLTDSTAIDDVLGRAAYKSSIELKSDITIRFQLGISTVKYNNALVFDSHYIVVSHDAYESNTLKTKVSNPISDDTTINTSSVYMFPYSITATQMGDNIDCYFYGMKDGVSYLLRVFDNYSIANYAESSIFGNASTEASLKTLVADMLKYGAQAQGYLGYHTDLFVDQYTETLANYISDNASEIVSKDTLTVNNTSYSDTIPDTETKLVQYKKTLALESRIEVNFKLHLNNFKNQYGSDAINDLTIEMKYVDGNNETKTVPLTIDDKAYMDGILYVFVCDQIIPSRMSSDASIHVYYNGKEISNSFYTIESFLSDYYDSTQTATNTYSGYSLGSLCKAIATYGNSAYNQFG